ncbi:MAG TPA: carbohydrate ABC transporter permease [Rugosimonospora sp.]|nr:carbohydrate ABC transporter permease [Rugosimonospora sp.]
MAATTAGVARRPAVRVRGAVRLIVVLVALFAVLYPLLWMLGTSLKSPAEIASNVALWPRHVTWSNFSQGWTGLPGVSFGRFFVNSTVIALGVVFANMASCLVTAYAFARLRFPLRRFWFAIMIGTLLLPHHVMLIPQYILFRHFGWINTPLPMIVPKVLATDAFFVFLMVQFMRGIPRDLDEAAKIDGASPLKVFWHVIAPLTRPALVTTAIFSFIWTWNDFFTQLIYLNDQSKVTVPVGLRMFMDSAGETALGPMFAMSVLSLIPVFLFFVAFQRLLVEGINTAGIKG